MIIRRIFAALAAAALLLLSGCSGGQSLPDLPDAETASACYDEANVLTPETENYIITQNDALFALTGAQIVVACVNTTGTTDISDYAHSLFNSWGIGSAEENNGVLVLLSIGEEDYWTLQGEGLEDSLPSGILKTMQNEFLEPDFAVKQYDAGVRLYFDAILTHLETLYSVDLDTWSGAPGAFTRAESETDSVSGGSFDAVMIAIVIVIVILIIVAIANGKGGSSGGGSSHGGSSKRHTSTPTVSIPRAMMRGGYYPNPRPTVRPPSRPSGGSFGGSSFGGSRGSSGGFRGGGGSSRGGGAGRR